jgi:predicted lipoprotein with Yx(FWY)xxD motif
MVRGKDRIRFAASIAIVVSLLSACSDDQATDGTGTGGGTAAEATVMTADSDLGEIVVDAEGMTLYVFFADEGGASTCYDDCEASWPPLTVEGDPQAGSGIDASLLGTAPRDDGSTQVTLDGNPLYHFSADETAGDTNGQGVGDVWYVVSPAGEPIQG